MSEVWQGLAGGKQKALDQEASSRALIPVQGPWSS